MKKFLALGSLLLSLSSYSQSYMVLGNGITLTTDTSAYVYDFGNFILPYKITLSGGQFLAEEGKIITIDEKGFLYRKDEKAPAKIKGKGNNYLISDGGNLFTFDAAGFLYKFDKEPATKKATNFGGNFFIVKSDDKKNITDLYTLNSKGNYFKMSVPGLNPATIQTLGGVYFQTNLGVIYTISKDGLVYSKSDVKTGSPKKLGGNYFIDSNNALYTISEEGLLLLPILPANLKIETVTKLGQNYLIDQNGKLFVINSKGEIFEREMKSHDLRDAKILSL